MHHLKHEVCPSSVLKEADFFFNVKDLKWINFVDALIVQFDFVKNLGFIEGLCINYLDFNSKVPRFMILQVY
jgi:hypothetical protein